jgi:SHS2 domain-containing protein
VAKEIKYRMLKHTSDVGIRVQGQDPKELYANAAFALFDLIADLNRVEIKETLRLEVEGSDRDDLMVSWLREVLYLFQASGYILREIEVREARETSIEAFGRGEKFDPDRHEIFRDIKGVIPNKCRTERTGDKWTAQVVFEI